MTKLSKDKVILDNIEFCSTELSYIYDYNTNLYSSFITPYDRKNLYAILLNLHQNFCIQMLMIKHISTIMLRN